jgi:hypothetical protein
MPVYVVEGLKAGRSVTPRALERSPGRAETRARRLGDQPVRVAQRPPREVRSVLEQLHPDQIVDDGTGLERLWSDCLESRERRPRGRERRRRPAPRAAPAAIRRDAPRQPPGPPPAWRWLDRDRRRGAKATLAPSGSGRPAPGPRHRDITGQTRTPAAPGARWHSAHDGLLPGRESRPGEGHAMRDTPPPSTGRRTGQISADGSSWRPPYPEPIRAWRRRARGGQGPGRRRRSVSSWRRPLVATTVPS